jgi:AraC-like DNA-binding protein
MDPCRFSTEPFRPRDQQYAWSEWFQPVFDVHSEGTGPSGFGAEYSVWNLGGVSVTRVSAPATRTVRTLSHLRRSPIDHWVISYSRNGPTAVSTRKGQLDAKAGVPFVWSLGQSSDSRRTAADRLQLYLPRDSFSEIGTSLDLAVGSMLETGPGHLLADYMLLLERNLPNLTPADAGRLPNAIRAMVAACVAPSADRLAYASPQVKLALMEKVRQAVLRNLRSPSLGPDKLCRETAMSRSQLYRILESEGGVARYIQSRRLSESYSILCDVSNSQPISEIAEALCFSDASGFSRAFRREFGMAPMEVRAAARSGMRPAPGRRHSVPREVRNFSDCLRSF